MGIFLHEACYYEKGENKIVKCNLCPWNCVLHPGQYGVCQARKNVDGVLYAMTYGKITAMWNDPIEKKPLFHWNPGSFTLSISSAGCNFKCPWCQNWEISQFPIEKIPHEDVEPKYVVELAKRYNSPSISYTYNEPLIWYEFLIDTMKLAKKEGLQNVIVSNGYINEDPLNDLLKYIDAANIDIKAFKEETYRKIIKGRLNVVLRNVEIMHKAGVHVETTYLVIPGLNDSIEEVKNMAKWHIETLGPDTPLHLSRFYPQYKYTQSPPTPIKILEKLRKIALNEGLNYVYLGNAPGHEGENTYCPKCGHLLIKRWGFSIIQWNLTEDMRCKYCGEKIPIKGNFYGKTNLSKLL